MDGQVLAFLGVAVLMTVTPGADMALLTKQALMNGRRAAFQTVFGITTGLVVWTALTAVGLAALLNASATAFTVLKLAGGAYLVYIGLQTIWQTRQRAAGNDPTVQAAGAARITGRQAYRQGLLSNLLNPKIGVFFTSFLPQFVSVDEPALPKLAFLGLIQIVIGIVWLAWYVQLVVKAGDLLRRPRVRRWLDRATGAVLIGLGLRLATERR